MVIAVEDEDWIVNRWEYIAGYEYLLPPEIAIELNHARAYDLDNLSYEGQIGAFYPHDVRKQITWKLGVLIYDLLHGYSPWELPEYDPNIGDVKDNRFPLNAGRVIDRAERRERIIHEELPISEELSQDCVDVIRTLLARDIDDRQTLLEVASMPWFQGHWADWPSDVFRRPDPRK